MNAFPLWYWAIPVVPLVVLVIYFTATHKWHQWRELFTIRWTITVVVMGVAFLLVWRMLKP